MKLSAKYLKEKSIIREKLGNYTFYRLILTEPAGQILDIVMKGRFYYKYIGLYDANLTPITLMKDLELIKTI